MIWLSSIFGAHAIEPDWHDEAICGMQQMCRGGHWVASSPFAVNHEPSILLDERRERHNREETFARFYVLSAAPSGDCDYGSGWNHGMCRKKTSFEAMVHGTPGTCRYGEARHPGPPGQHLLRIGTANTTGVRRKEKEILEMGVGLWHLTETHLTKATARSSVGILKRLARQQNREVRCVTGAPVPIRSNSSWAGSWAGVAVVADYPTIQLQVPFPDDHWNSARILMTRTWIGQSVLTCATFYGYSTSPAWPRSRFLSDEILAGVTKELVMGCGGLRAVAGDFNSSPGHLSQQRIWQAMGWRNAQDVGRELLGHTWCPTYGGTTEPDQVWLSPEAIMLLKGVTIEEHFMGHSSVAVDLAIPTTSQTVSRWPLPSEIPWDDYPNFKHETGSFEFPQNATMTERYGSWAFQVESALKQHATDVAEDPLPPRCLGRAARRQPEKSNEVMPISRASRHGEITLCSDLVGKAVRQWFGQARKLQSLCHAVRAQKNTPEAIAYRLALWSSIKQSKGFENGFSSWWAQRKPMLHADPIELPQGIPLLQDAEAIFAEFQQHFRAFERWHLNQRSQILAQKHRDSSQQLYRELRPPMKDTPDLFWSEVEYEVIAKDDDDNLVQLDRAPSTQLDCNWCLEGRHVQLTDFDEAVCRVPLSHSAQVEVGSVLTQRIFVSNLADMHTTLSDFWKLRWQGEAQLPEAQWQRITAFAGRYLPRLELQWPKLEPEMLKHTAGRMKVKAARGTDGVARSDVINLPEYLLSPLTDLLREVETGADWPQQLAHGLVISTAKTVSAHEPKDYRPITVLPVPYRLWSSLRTRHMLRLLKPHLPSDILGFVPECETSQVWLHLQTWIETSQIQEEPLCGISSDLQKAFNNIGRKQVHFIARHLGLPPDLLVPWFQYLECLQRRFELRGTLGEAIQSTKGLPEGCPLSIIGMILINWCHSIYMKAYDSQVQLMVFVDNLTYVSSDPGVLMHGYLNSQTFHELWGLCFDEEKTFSWGTVPTLRSALRSLGLRVKNDASELGGFMNYTRKQHVRLLGQRGEGLDDKWTRLRSSSAPHFRKLWALPSVFWAASLHATANLHVSGAYLQELRRKAMKGLRWQAAGTNPTLKLSLTSCPMADPGMYDLRMGILTFVRALRKTPDLVHSWRYWYDNEPKSASPGPLSALSRRLEKINWRVEYPPTIRDHHGFRHDLSALDTLFFNQQLYDGWLQYVAGQVRHKTMQDLHGLETHLVILDHQKLPALQYHRVLALQSGAFLSASQHAKFDGTKVQTCQICNVVDDRKHWFSCPRFETIRASLQWNRHDWMMNLPNSLVYHLLPSRQESWHELRDEHAMAKSGIFDFVSTAVTDGMHHLFTDGSLHDGRCPFTARAAWAVICATTTEVTASAHLSGPRQSIDRAEISAIISAAAWGGYCGVHTCIWSDSSSSIQLAERIEQSHQILGICNNLDLWQLFLEVVIRFSRFTRRYRWIPSHLDPSAMADPFEDWAASWNAKADRVAVETNLQRTATYWQKCSQIQKEVENMKVILYDLRQFYLKVAETTAPQQNEASMSTRQILPDGTTDDSLFDALPITWQPTSMILLGTRSLPSRAIIALLEQLHRWDREGQQVYEVTDLELCCALVSSDFLFPFWQASENQWMYRRYHDCFERPTITRLHRFVVGAMGSIVDSLDCSAFRVQINGAHGLGIHMKCMQTLLRMPTTVRCQAAERLRTLGARRPFRRAADLSRPL